MPQLITNMRILTKISIPAVVTAAACFAIVVYAIVGLNGLAGTVDSVIAGEATRVDLALEAGMLFNSAAVTEKNAILYPGEKDVRASIDLYAKITSDVLRTVDRLAAITRSADQLSLVEAFREAVGQRARSSAKVFEFALRQQQAAAFEVSRTEGAAARKAATDSVGKLIALNRKRLQEARADAQARAVQARAVLVATSMVGLGIAFSLLAWIAALQIGRPIGAMTHQMERLASGDLTVEVVGAQRRDEVGGLARSLEVFKRNAIAARRLEAEQQAEQAAKEMRHQAVDACIAVFDTSARQAIETLAAAATELGATSKSMSTIAGETSRQATVVAAGSEEASTNVQAVAQAAEELSASIGEITRQVAASAQIASAAVA